MIAFLSGYWVWLIFAFAIVNIYFWITLVITARKTSRLSYAWLESAVRPFSRQRDQHPDSHKLDSIDKFLADIRDVVEDPKDGKELSSLNQRLSIKSEAPPHGLPHGFERMYGLCRAGIESFPLLGILGTVLAIAAGMNASSDGGGNSQISRVVTNFGESVYCTGLGIFFAILFSLVNGWFEPSFERVIRQSHSLDELILAVKKKVGFAAE